MLYSKTISVGACEEDSRSGGRNGMGSGNIGSATAMRMLGSSSSSGISRKKSSEPKNPFEGPRRSLESVAESEGGRGRGDEEEGLLAGDYTDLDRLKLVYGEEVGEERRTDGLTDDGRKDIDCWTTCVKRRHAESFILTSCNAPPSLPSSLPPQVLLHDLRAETARPSAPDEHALSRRSR